MDIQETRRKPRHIHDIYIKGTERESIVRHRETDEELAKAIIKINRLERENKELKINLEKIVKEKCPVCEFNLNKMNGWRLEDL